LAYTLLRYCLMVRQLYGRNTSEFSFARPTKGVDVRRVFRRPLISTIILDTFCFESTVAPQLSPLTTKSCNILTE
jgi:hypothetical protein